MGREKIATDAIELLYPGNRTVLALDALRFSWAPCAEVKAGSNLRYRLFVFHDDPERAVGKAPADPVVFKSEQTEATSRQLSISEAKRLAEYDQLYWRVEAEDIVSGRIYWSPTLRFAGRLPYRNRVGAFTSPTVEIDGGFLEPFNTCPPSVWGCPVLLRFESDRLPEEHGGEGSGTVEPLPVVWATEAAELFLISAFWERCQVLWDYSDESGCDKVLLQISDGGGFRQPRALDARADEGVHIELFGAKRLERHDDGRITPQLTYGEGAETFYVDPHKINLQGTHSPPWPSVQVRTALLDSDGNQLGAATDHVTVHCVDPPALEVVDEADTWIWEEIPKRRLEITVRCIDGLGSAPFRGPATLCIATVPDFPGMHITLPDFPELEGLDDDFADNVSCVHDGNELPVRRVRIPADVFETEEPPHGRERCIPAFWDRDAYVVDIEEWTPDSTHHFVLEQNFHPWWANYALWCFLNPVLSVYCAPGLRPTWPFAAAPLPQIDYRVTWDSLVAGGTTCSTSTGLSELYDFFSRPFVGHRVSSVDGEQDVRIEFEFDDMTDAASFGTSLIRAVANYVHETIGGVTETYVLRWLGLQFYFHTSGRVYDSHRPPDYLGTTPNVYLGVDSGTLEMHFEILLDTVDEWGSPEWGTLDYYLTHE